MTRAGGGPPSTERGRKAESFATLLERVEQDEKLALFRFEPEGGVPEFQPGQYVPLGLAGHNDPTRIVWRSFSIASPPEEKRYFEIYVRWVVHPRPGRFTTSLGELKVGDRILWKRPRGSFTIENQLPSGAPDERRLLLLSSGTGLAPYMSYVRHLRLTGSEREIVLCHGASHVSELGYREVLEELENASSAEGRRRWRFHYLPTISRPLDEQNREWRGATGRVEALLDRPEPDRPSPLEDFLREKLDPATSFVHVCGLRGTVDALLEILRPLGFRPPRESREDGTFDLKYEAFG